MEEYCKGQEDICVMFSEDSNQGREFAPQRKREMYPGRFPLIQKIIPPSDFLIIFIV